MERQQEELFPLRARVVAALGRAAAAAAAAAEPRHVRAHRALLARGAAASASASASEAQLDARLEAAPRLPRAAQRTEALRTHQAHQQHPRHRHRRRSRRLGLAASFRCRRWRRRRRRRHWHGRRGGCRGGRQRGRRQRGHRCLGGRGRPGAAARLEEAALAPARPLHTLLELRVRRLPLALQREVGLLQLRYDQLERLHLAALLRHHRLELGVARERRREARRLALLLPPQLRLRPLQLLPQPQRARPQRLVRRRTRFEQGSQRRTGRNLRWQRGKAAVGRARTVGHRWRRRRARVAVVGLLRRGDGCCCRRRRRRRRHRCRRCLPLRRRRSPPLLLPWWLLLPCIRETPRGGQTPRGAAQRQVAARVLGQLGICLAHALLEDLLDLRADAHRLDAELHGLKDLALRGRDALDPLPAGHADPIREHRWRRGEGEAMLLVVEVAVPLAADGEGERSLAHDASQRRWNGVLLVNDVGRARDDELALLGRLLQRDQLEGLLLDAGEVAVELEVGPKLPELLGRAVT